MCGATVAGPFGGYASRSAPEKSDPVVVRILGDTDGVEQVRRVCLGRRCTWPFNRLKESSAARNEAEAQRALV
jgi:hypothetical protein